MCDKIIQMFESRLNVIEQKIDTKCDESKVRDIVKDELAKAQDQITSYADVAASESGKRVDKVEMTTVVVDLYDFITHIFDFQPCCDILFYISFTWCTEPHRVRFSQYFIFTFCL
jgi:DNA polymerase II small subunit/DNA polymerase delta subunit B